MPFNLTMNLPDDALIPLFQLLQTNFQSLEAQLELISQAAPKVTDPNEKQNFEEYEKLLGIQLAIVGTLLQNYPKTVDSLPQDNIILDSSGVPISVILDSNGQRVQAERKLIV